MPAAESRPRPRYRTLLAIGLGAFLPLALLAGLAVLEATRSYRAADEARLRGTVRALTGAVDAQLGGYVTAARALSHGPMLDGAGNPELFEANARPVGREFGTKVIVLGPPPDFGMFANSLRPPGGTLPAIKDPATLAALAAPLAQVFGEARPGVSDLLTGPIDGRPNLWAFAPVRRGEQVTRAVAIGFEPAALRDLLAGQDLPPGSFAAIADGEHRILAHSLDPEGRRLGATAPDWVAAAITDRPRGMVTGPGLSGQPVVYAFERPALAPRWTVVVAVPQAALEASARRATGWMAAGGGALLLGLAMLAWVAWRTTTEAARQETAALRAGRAEIERLHAGLPALVFLRSVAPDGTSRLLYRGGDAEAICGWPAAAIARSPDLAEFYAPDHMPLPEFLRRVLREGSARAEWRMRQPDGTWRWLVTRAQVLSRDAQGGGEVVGYIVSIQAEREALARLTAAGRLAALGEMAAGLAHELKQPLAIISLAAQNAANALRTGKPDGAIGRLDRIADQAGRAGEMIEHLRRFARGADAGAQSGPLPVRRAVDGALALVGGALREDGIAVELSLGPPPGPVALGHLVPLEQVLVNLLSNARDALAALPPGRPRLVRIAADREGPAGPVRITVADTGGGIPPGLLDRLFEPFVTTKDAEKGTGLGLSISHGLVRGMGGRIDVANGAEGAVFTITLPAAPEPAEAAQEAASAGA